MHPLLACITYLKYALYQFYPAMVIVIFIEKFPIISNLKITVLRKCNCFQTRSLFLIEKYSQNVNCN